MLEKRLDNYNPQSKQVWMLMSIFVNAAQDDYRMKLSFGGTTQSYVSGKLARSSHLFDERVPSVIAKL